MVIHGFELLREREMPDVHGTLYEYVHEKTGAKLAWLKRDDDNKTFTISFKTTPVDDTGVFHILEHSVLNGSDKYPVREPFVELLKGSMQTFLNAFTYPDKTMYPVSSRVDQDFMNLMSVYMDAVFHPAIYTNPNIFRQEGWHYEIRSEADEPVYKGVVLNEMKGAFSSVDEAIVNEVNRMLFTENCYQYVSGGDPEHITDLSYEQFIETHKTYYHPSNARVFLDGDMDIDRVLAFINDEYFSHYEKEDKDFSIPFQKEEKSDLHRITYEMNPGEETDMRSQIAFARIVSSFDNIEKNIAWQALCSVLVSTNESPLKKNIIDAGLGEDVELELMDGIQQPWVVLAVRNTNEEHYEAVRAKLNETVEKMLDDGLDHNQIIATLNQMEFRYREKHEPAGIMFAQRAMDAWLYDGDPAQNLSIGTLFETLRQKSEEGYFESLLREFAFSDQLSTVIAVPDVNKGSQREAHEAEKLAKAKASWGDEIQKLIAENQELDTWQATPDTEEQINTLPKLALSDISEEPMKFEYEERRVRGVPVILHPSQDTGIVYMNFYFSLAGLRREDLPSLGFFTGLLTSLPTSKHTVEELQEAIRRDLGGLSFFADAYTVKGDRNATIPVLGVTCSVLKQNIDKAISLILEIMHETVFTKETVLPLLKQDNEDFRQALQSNGHSIAMRRAAAHFSAEGVFREYVGGYTSGLYQKNFEKNYDEMIDEFLNECEMYSEVLFSRDRLTASVTGEENLHAAEDLIDGLHTIDAMRAKEHYPLLTDMKEFISISGGVSYSAMCGNTYAFDAKWDSRMIVLSHILTYDWLWNEVRVKGGAYGTGFSSNPNGNLAAYSYRDPDVTNAMKAYRTASQRIREMAENNEDISNMIIGTMAASEPLLSPLSKIRVTDSLYFRESDPEIRKKNRIRNLHTTAADLGEYADILEKVMNDNPAICIVGNEDALKKCADLEMTELEKI